MSNPSAYNMSGFVPQYAYGPRVNDYYAQPAASNSAADVTAFKTDYAAKITKYARDILNNPDPRHTNKIRFAADVVKAEDTALNFKTVDVDTTLAKVNKPFIGVHGLKSVFVTSLIHHEKTATAPATAPALQALRACYTLILGRRNPFTLVPLELALDDLKDHTFSAVFYGVRSVDNKQPPMLHTYFYSEDNQVRLIIGKVKDVFDAADIPIKFVDPTTCRDECADIECVEQIGEQAWMCAVKEDYIKYLKRLRPPAEENQMAMFAYLLAKDVKAKNAPLSAPFEIKAVNLCNMKCNELTKVWGIQHGSFSQLEFLASYAFVNFVCWLSDDNNTKLEKSTVNGWRICQYTHAGVLTADNDEVRVDARKGASGAIEVYVQHIHSVMFSLEMMLEELLGPGKIKDSDKACYGSILCKYEGLKRHINHAKEKANADTYKTDTSLCMLAGLRSCIKTCTTQFVKFVMEMRKAVGTMTVPASVSNVLTDAMCKLANIVVPWLNEEIEMLETFFVGVRLLNERASDCLKNVIVESPVVTLALLLSELEGIVPSLFDHGKKPGMKELRDLMTKKPNTPEAYLAYRILSIDTVLHMQRRAAEADLTDQELHDAERQFCEAFEHAKKKFWMGETDANGAIRQVFSLFEEFRRSAGLSDHQLISKALKKRKEDDEKMLDMCDKALARVRDVAESLSRMRMKYSVPAVPSYLLSLHKEDMPEKFGAVLAANNCKDKRIQASISRTMRRGMSVARAAGDSIAIFAETMKRAPGEPSLSPDVAGEVFPYCQTLLRGVMDDDYYLPARTSLGTSDFFKIDAKSSLF